MVAAPIELLGGLKSGEEFRKIESMKEEKAAVISDHVKSNNGNGKIDKKVDESKSKNAAALPSAAPAIVLKGSLVADLDTRQHVIRGKWNFINADPLTTPSQDFEFICLLPADVEDPSFLPLNGLFNGSFAILLPDKKGKMSITSVKERELFLTFTKTDDSGNQFKAKGRGSNRYGNFEVKGTAKKNPETGKFSVDLKKSYITIPDGSNRVRSDELPPPTPSHPEKVVCLQGKLEMADVDGTAHHRVKGKWSSGLNLLKEDAKDTCNPFELVHKCTLNTSPFPVSGKYTGWFLLNSEVGKEKQKISEKDVALKFRKNSAGGYNVEGKGLNVFGKYSITGTLGKDNVLLIFRHFHIGKAKRQSSHGGSHTLTDKGNNISAVNPSMNTFGSGVISSLQHIASESAKKERRFSLADVEIDEGDDVPIFKKPETGQYSAVMRGTLKVNEDLAHTCVGKWAAAREHFDASDGRVKNFKFHFGIESQNVKGDGFPYDSDRYKGYFNMKKGSSKVSSVIDKQIVLKYRKNKEGSYNVAGKGHNSIGEFNLIGKLVPITPSSGQVELYRIYDQSTFKNAVVTDRKAIASKGMNRPPKLPIPAMKPPKRQSKAPIKLEDEHNQMSNLNQVMKKCLLVLRVVREKDLSKLFSEPVDPVALKIPTYNHVVKNPMDFSTIKDKILRGDISDHEEFARLTRLVFDNAMAFTPDENTFVHKTAKSLAAFFNHKLKDVDKLIQNLASSKNSSPQSGGESRYYNDDTGTHSHKKKKSNGESGKKKSKKKRSREHSHSGISDSSKKKGKRKSSDNSSGLAPAPDGFVSLSDYKKLQEQMFELKRLLESYKINRHVSSSPKPTLSSDYPVQTERKPSKKSKNKKGRHSVPSSFKSSASNASDDESFEESSLPAYKELSFREQQKLTETINKLPVDKLQGVITIIRENMKLSTDSDEIDLEIDQLDTQTQRKLQRYVMKNSKPRNKPTKKRPAPAPKTIRSKPSHSVKEESPEPMQQKSPAKKQKTEAKESLNCIGLFPNDESDDASDYDSDVSNPPGEASRPASEYALAPEGDFDDDFDDADDANWQLSNTAAKTDVDGDDGPDDSLWDEARKENLTSKTREAERSEREARKQAAAAHAAEERLANARADGDRKKALKLEEQQAKEKEAEEKERKADEEKKAAMEKAKLERQSVEQHVDMDAQRVIMANFNLNFSNDNMSGSASPSSDFGF
eukprot:CAMPEP_0194277178 /NCGR_PEP_ID=MMETSP0169-20130528/9566_1 /TAXON_ID=218684 /ORGANISM="Corethron pennatum, Strain L29A3" /LENGTH=1212 /DNA_ID=CAMNT_0039021077 /DNA_START=1190 /DNA_END=4828 /DNA_ORIENTATION=+